MSAPHSDMHLCSWCKRIVIRIRGGKVVEEVPLSTTGYKASDWEPEGSHGICSVCSQELRKDFDKKRVRSNPPVWAVDRAKWNRARKIVQESYGLRGSKLRAGDRRKVRRSPYAIVSSIYRQLGGRVKRKARGNPSSGDWDSLIRLYTKWTGRAPEEVMTVKVDTKRMPDAVVYLGHLLAVEYRSDKYDVKAHTYRHEFSKRDLPVLVADHTGQLWVVGGSYKINQRGIVG